MARQLTEQEIVERFDSALAGNNIYVCYQAQMNHATNRMVGAEALMRWEDPEHGAQYPSDFIPVLEQNDLIFRADLFVFEEVCRLQKFCLDKGIVPVPISVNMSRYDIYHDHKYVEEIEKIRQKYQVPVHLLRIEITESSAIGGTDLILSVLKNLHDHLYVVEMDDFGSGYSSLNILKDLDVDIIKLDMNFLNGRIGGRGGTIISSMVQMTKWLNTPVIAEGVETIEQADYMKSIGCYYIQGYLYAKPVKRDVFLKKLTDLEHETQGEASHFIREIGSGEFWNPDSMETLLFNNFVGPAAVFTYTKGVVETLRVNQKYIEELGMNVTEKDVLGLKTWEGFDEEAHKVYESAIRKAIESGEEEVCETWRDFKSKCCGQDRSCIRSYIRVIGKAGEQYLFYSMIRNITIEKEHLEQISGSEKKFRLASEMSNTFAWEYTIATKEMRPCARCKRILGFPDLLTNYPEPAIEQGVFPADYADMYRDWHEQLAAGAESLEAIIPLTPDRIPFHVRYTAEFDENGRPYKAYGSATQVVD